jgi:hypothetical protein
MKCTLSHSTGRWYRGGLALDVGKPLRAGFNIADEQLDDDARRKIMRRVHEGAEVRLMGGYADGSGASKTDLAEPVSAPSNTDVLKSPGPRPPK